MPTYIKGPTRIAKGSKLPKVAHAMNGDLCSYNNTPPARQLLRWAKPTGEIKLVKVGPRNPPAPTLGDLVAKFNR